MPYLNRAEIMGNLGQTPEVKYTAERLPIVNLSVATNRRFKRANGTDWEQETEWHSVVVFGAQAERCGKYLGKGDRVYVDGRIQTREYESQGQKHRRTEIVADKVLFLSGRHAEANTDEPAAENP